MADGTAPSPSRSRQHISGPSASTPTSKTSPPSTSSARPPIHVRKMGFDFEQVPRRWLFNSTFATHVANGLNLIFPAGERFFIRSVRYYLNQVEDPQLRAEIRAFFGQEGSHGHEHERAFTMLKSQGFEIDTWLAWYQKLAFERIESISPPVLRLATTAALEHFTATLAERGLSDNVLDHAHPQMRDLLRWHAAEEIEHKSVAFDVLKQVNPSYGVRLAGMVIGVVMLLFFWRSATRMLLAQEHTITKEQLRRERKNAAAHGQNRHFIWKAVVEYLNPNFHPDQRDNYALARDYLHHIGRLEG